MRLAGFAILLGLGGGGGFHINMSNTMEAWPPRFNLFELFKQFRIGDGKE